MFKGDINALTEIARVRRMPLSGLPVARPMSLIENPSGYTLQFQRDMDVVRSMKYSHRYAVRDWWLDTGGLVRRLWIGARIAAVFERLHSRGLVYGDVSSNNIMVSKAVAFTEVSLIDLDNLFYFGERDAADLWTPWYSAPEVAIDFQVPTFASDNFSLAVVLFELLTMVHPFKDGLAVKNASTDSELYQLAEQCMVPSVLDSAGGNICSNYPIQHEKELLGGVLSNLFCAAFESKNVEISKRPRAGELRMGIVRAALSVIECSKCDWSYSVINLQSCPDCDHIEQYRIIKLLSADGVAVAYEIILGAKKKSIDLAVLFPILREREPVRDSYVLDLQLLNESIRVTPHRDSSISVPRQFDSNAFAKIEGFGELKLVIGYQ
jgi:serine/threonine protein kinase